MNLLTYLFKGGIGWIIGAILGIASVILHMPAAFLNLFPAFGLSYAVIYHYKNYKKIIKKSEREALAIKILPLWVALECIMSVSMWIAAIKSM